MWLRDVTIALMAILLKEAFMNDTMTRRQVLITGIKAATLVPTSLLFGCGSGKGGTVQPSSPTVGLNGSTVQPISPTSGLDQTISGLDTRLHQELINSGKLASVGGQWSELAFNDLIDSMGEDSLKRTCKTLDISSSSLTLRTSESHSVLHSPL